MNPREDCKSKAYKNELHKKHCEDRLGQDGFVATDFLLLLLPLLFVTIFSFKFKSDYGDRALKVYWLIGLPLSVGLGACILALTKLLK